MYQPSASRQREQAQGLGGRGAVDDDDVPAAGERMQAQLEERQHLLGAGDDGQLLGRDRVDPGHVEHREQVALDVGPGLLEAQLCVDLLHVEPVGDLGRLGADDARRAAVRIGEGVRRVGREHRGCGVPGGRQGGRPGRDGGLPDPLPCP